MILRSVWKIALFQNGKRGKAGRQRTVIDVGKEDQLLFPFVNIAKRVQRK